MSLNLKLNLGFTGTQVVRLPAPTNLLVSDNESTVDASWDAVTGASSYEYFFNGVWTNNGLMLSVTGLSAASYGDGVFRVRAIDGLGVKGRTATGTFHLNYPVPSAPQSLSVVADGLDYDATWSAPASNAAYVTYYRVRINGGSWANNGTSTTYVGSGTAGSYTIDVDAVNADGADGADASDTFDLTDPTGGLMFQPADSPMFTPADSLMFQ